MRTFLLAAMLVGATSLVALAPSASAIVCTTGWPDQCVGQGTDGCLVWADGDVLDACLNRPPPPPAGVCVGGSQVVGTTCTINAPNPRNDGVCIGNYQVTGVDPGCDYTTWPNVGFAHCGGGVYALHVLGGQTQCMWTLP